MKLSVCMMVKDGGELFAKALKSIKEFADELVLVNTDQAEDTPDTRAALALKAHMELKLIHSPWRDDFSFHRNQSINSASGDWLLCLDGDEEAVLPQGKAALIEWLAGLAPDVCCGGVLLHDMRGGSSVMQMSQPRLFRKGAVEYRGRVHNQVYAVTGGELRQVHTPLLELRHYGYDPDLADMAAKRKRRVRLLNKQLDDGDYNAYFWLMQDAGMHGEEDLALEYAQRYLEHQDDLPDGKMNPNVYFPAARRYLMRGELDKSAEWLDLGWQAIPGDLDLCAAKSDLAAAKGDFETMAQAAVEYVGAYKAMQRTGPFHGRFCFTFQPSLYAYYLCRACLYRLRVGLLMHRELCGLLPRVPQTVRDEVEQELSLNLESWQPDLTSALLPSKNAAEMNL